MNSVREDLHRAHIARRARMEGHAALVITQDKPTGRHNEKDPAPGSAGSRSTFMHNLSQSDLLSNLLARARIETFYTELDVTPEMASRLLELNVDNRPLRMEGQRSVRSYAESMSRGEWTINGQNIVVSCDGRLNDGQHRLSAVVVAGHPVRMGFVFGVSRESRNTVDQGVKRTPGHILAMRGEKDSNHLGAALRFLAQIDGTKELTPDQLIAMLEKHPRMRDAVPPGRRISRRYSLGSAPVIVAYYVCASVDRALADRLADTIATGVGITSKSDPAHQLMQRYMAHLNDRKGKGLSSEEQYAFFVKTFNNLRSGRIVDHLRYRERGAARESLPMPK